MNLGSGPTGSPHPSALERENARLRRELEHMLQSRSWRWTAALRAAGSALSAVRRRATRRRRKILFIDHNLPLVDRDSGSVRLRAFLRLLAADGNDVTFIPFDGADHPSSAADLRALGIRVLCGPEDSVSAHLQAEGGTYDTVIMCRMPFARQYIADVRRYAPQAKQVFDTVDLHFLRLSRRAEVQDDPHLRSEAALWRSRELELMHGTDCTVVVSGEEQALLADIAPGVPVFVISNIHRIAAEPAWNEERRSILFLGNFHHDPNVDAVRNLARTILPLVRGTLPGVTLEIAGGYPPGTIEDLAEEGIVIHGHVPDLGPLFRRARVFAAPLRYGAGVKGKLHMSMAYGVPFVTTSVGAEGMHLRDGIDALIADDEHAFAACITRLYGDRALWERTAAAAQDILRKHFSDDAASAEIRRMFAFLDRR